MGRGGLGRGLRPLSPRVAPGRTVAKEGPVGDGRRTDREEGWAEVPTVKVVSPVTRTSPPERLPVTTNVVVSVDITGPRSDSRKFRSVP